MVRDQIFQATSARAADFEFNGEVAEVFDDMLVRSIPLYVEQQCLIKEIATKFWVDGADFYDLGCSTGTTLLNVAPVIARPCRFIGYDNSVPMLDRARLKIREQGFEERIELRRADLNGDLDSIELRNAGVVAMCWTLQFIRPLNRDRVIQWIYSSLVENGVFILLEKVLTNNSHMNRFFIDFYYDYKRRNSYSNLEIQRKREALENVLIPYRIDENLEMLRKGGFEIVEMFFQWYNFGGFLCMKAPALRS
jgi:tRNA (cmo5U34)-methyltransferase